ncbi:hypothetical protein MFLO_01935 [Listeria floridensis FSL S10-1187]|uniref:WXG100 family type VII secretion target n=1 Tax=Listeria floridensis FSL S10-1187 TaxID=1265817 RepID=A0ABP3B1W7_9LIST|nr:WXG100 family type VII secretion target [Listeria floridensis]EUJ33939.1 hypothetical protein MFLO_01935 [Listeria floridensis FSL S10-1187]
MADVKISAEKVETAKQQAKIVEDALSSTHKKCKAIISYASSAKWDGKARDAFLTYMELIEKYHAEVKKEFKKQSKALKNLNGYLADFEDTSEVREVKNL